MVTFKECSCEISYPALVGVRDKASSSLVCPMTIRMGFESWLYELANALVVLSQTTEDGEIEVRISVGLSLYAATISAKQARDNFSYDDVGANTKRGSEATKKTCPECYGRGYCEEKDGNIKCLCFEQFYEGADCMTEVNHCKTNPCENDGDCQPVWGNYFCKCRKGFHGVNCTEQVTLSASSTEIESKYVTSCLHLTGLYHMFCLLKARLRGWRDHSSCTTWKSRYPARKQNKMGYIVRGYSYTSNGGPVYISVKIKNKNTVQFEGRYLVVPEKNPSFCTPTILMQDWYELVSSLYHRPETGVQYSLGDDGRFDRTFFPARSSATEYDKAPMYKREERFSVRSKTTPDCSDQEPQLSQYWFQYNISDDAPVPADDTFGALDTDWNSPTEYAFQPFTMNFGFYLMKVAVLEEVNEILGAQKNSFWNENMCGFHVVPAGLVACMVGGESATVGVHQELQLSAELSFDPNESPYNQQHLSYKWSCWTSTRSKGHYCKGKGVQVGTGMSTTSPRDKAIVHLGMHF
ncbi:unnamed protein product [Timema podura]|uniref:EGF-like domain-containing protein n=1 Tax=Timema podura TaxID=61482 RepID=A0ABN7NTJ8_TIMPD|nr:unnamed protein product [Timema podura]